MDFKTATSRIGSKKRKLLLIWTTTRYDNFTVNGSLRDTFRLRKTVLSPLNCLRPIYSARNTWHAMEPLSLQCLFPQTAPCSLSLQCRRILGGETPYAGKRSSWLVRHRKVNWCLSINCKSIMFIPFGIGAAGNVVCITQWESQRDFYTGHQDKICSQY